VSDEGLPETQKDDLGDQLSGLVERRGDDLVDELVKTSRFARRAAVVMFVVWAVVAVLIIGGAIWLF
jgi:cell division protein FtsX